MGALTYRTRVILTFVIPWVAASVFSFWYISYVQRAAGERDARRHLGLVTDMLATSVGSGLNDGDFTLVQKAFDWSRLDRNVTYICIFDEKDEVLYQSASVPDVRIADIKRFPSGITHIGPGLLSVAEVVPGGKKLGTVILLYSLEGIEREIASARLTSVVVSLVVLLVGIFGTRLLIRQASALERSNLTLTETQRELQQAHDGLERRVEERTTALADANAELHTRQGYLDLAMTAARMFPWRMDLATGAIAVSGEHLANLGLATAERDFLVAHLHPDDRARVVGAFRAAGETGAPLNTEFRALLGPDGLTWFAAFGRVMTGPNGRPTHIVGINMDITERKRIDDAIRTSLREKETLLKEVHHRVKNNMQIISSLLFLQSSYVRDPHDQDLFRESQLRVKSMATVHERLYRSEDLSSIEFGEYVRTIADELLASYQRPGINLRTAVEEIRFGVDIAIPCGLLITELVTNAIKHAFPDGRAGCIEIEGSLAEGKMVLSVSDDGIGYPATLDVTGGATLGVMLIRGLTDQLEGTITLDRSRGSRITITFPFAVHHPISEGGVRA